MEYSQIETQLGPVVIYFTRDQIKRITLGQESDDLLLSRASPAECLPWPDLETELANYFRGMPIVNKYPVCLEEYSDWTRRVLLIASAIPYGEVCSYKQVAANAGSPGGARAAGQALSRNRTPLLIPCHRVVGQKRNLVGFGSGLTWKKGLLELERGTKDALFNRG